MIIHPDLKPKIRQVEPFLEPDQRSIGVRDPSGASQVVLSLSEPAFFVLTLLDGETTLTQVQEQVRQRYGQPVKLETLAELVERLDEGLMLEGPRFEAHRQELLAQYRAEPVRPMRSASSLGLDGDAQGLFREMLQGAEPVAVDGRICGLIAPHLDYRRGCGCYAAAYATLAEQPPPDRCVVLGTNHFGLGRMGSVVATGHDFATPLGTTSTDRAFIKRLEGRCGDLRRHEYDHLAEHSVELQVCWLQHLFGAENFQIVPFLCPDPCGPSGTQPYDGEGVDLADFARALGEEVAADGKATLVIAGADLSHIGGFFGDERALDDEFLAEVRQRDADVLECVEQVNATALQECVAKDENPTRVCSAGCVFVLLTALPGAKATVLKYHQAVEPAVQNCVTCAAVVFRQ